MEKFKFIVCGYQNQQYALACLESIHTQRYKDFQVCVVDDATPDPEYRAWLKDYCDARGWMCILNDVNMGAMYNQIHGIRAMDPDPEDVIVFVDGDDRLKHDKVLNRLNFHYSRGVRLTYGQYESEPYSPTCTPAHAYPSDVIFYNNYRAYAVNHGGLRYNHLRTLKYDLLMQCDDNDFKDEHGNWFVTGTDCAIMIPCMELALGKIKCLDEVLYVYTSESPLADWRLRAAECDRNHWYILNCLKKKVP